MKEDAEARHLFNLFFFRLPCCCFPLSCPPSSDLSPYDSRLLKAGKLLIDILKLLLLFCKTFITALTLPIYCLIKNSNSSVNNDDDDNSLLSVKSLIVDCRVLVKK